MSPDHHERILLINEVSIDLITGMVTYKDKQPVHLQPKFLEVLERLVQAYPNVVSRQSLIERVWQGNNYVGEKALTNAIWHLRKALTTEKGELIGTVRKNGYYLLEKPHVMKQPAVNGLKLKLRPALLVLSMFAAVVALIFGRDFWHSNLEDSHTLENTFHGKVTKLSGREAFPAVSPNDELLAYYWRPLTKNQDLYVQSLGRQNADPIQLTFDDYLETRPVWSKDGQRIFFVQKAWNLSACNIVELNITTLAQNTIASCRADVNPALALSNDGNTLAYAGADELTKSVGIYTVDLTEQPYRIARFSCTDECEFSDRDAVFSPDDSQFLMTRRTQLHEEDLFLVDRKTKQSKRLTTGFRNVLGKTWHPYQNYAVFAAEYSQSRSGFVINMDTFEVEELAIDGFSYPTFSPSGDTIYYHHLNTRSHIAALDATAEVNALPFPVLQSEFSYSYPTVDSRSERMAFISNESGERELWMSKIDGSDAAQLTNLQSNIFFPKWSPSGDQIAFLLRKSASSETSIAILDVRTKAIDIINVDALSNLFVPNWSSDGTKILSSATFTDAIGIQSDGYFAINLETNHVEKLSQHSNGAITISDDGETIWFSDHTKALYQASLSSREATPQVLLAGKTLASSSSWTKVGNSIYFLQRYSEHEQINKLNLTDKEVSTIAKAPLRTFPSGMPLAFDTSRERLILSTVDYAGVDIEMISRADSIIQQLHQ
ncbi:winged helix-turn-helix domain-containing protein [Ningiella sp. W23]|uniref:winged helix-turn-helix domain-containing protein n=1 Tax=Ningiella sp. W23 TaxID=3023715 RepID=UPI003756F0EA